ncbi:Heavy metal-associated isoprenylated plant protein 7 [Salvia divinorum]|uniref:Heavy metal-associated isoprenylated plant protein 7 n=1 Tax=Salvia divinorum TaxID=28513 RepID=A0ABD1HC12_SALDI
MGEEEKKPEEPKPKPEEKKEDPPKPAEDAPKDDKKPEEQPPPSPPPPQEIVLKVYMHCEGCARKVRRCLKGFDGVEDVMTDCRTSKVVVKGEKADPLKVLERVQRKSHRQVELISPIPPPPAAEEEKKPEAPKPEVKKEELPVITVVLGVYMHCEACAQELKKRIQRMKGVESVEPDLKSSQVTVKGVLDAEKLTDYVHKRTGKHATVVKVEPAAKKEEEKEEKKPEEAEKEAKKEGGGEKEKKEEAAAKTEAAPAAEGEETKVVELKKNEMQMQMQMQYYYYPNYYHQQPPQQVYPQRFMQEYQLEYPPPQMFSDENPNACSVM